MKLIILTIGLLCVTTSAFTQEIFGGINFGTFKSLLNEDAYYPEGITMINEADILWKSKKHRLMYNGLNVKFGLKAPGGYQFGMGYKSLFGLNFNETYDKNNIGIESTVGIVYQAPTGLTPIAIYGVGVDMSLGVRFRFFQNYGAKIMYNLSYVYESPVERLNIISGFSFGLVGPLWVNKKSVFKRKKALKLLPGEKW